MDSLGGPSRAAHSARDPARPLAYIERAPSAALAGVISSWWAFIVADDAPPTVPHTIWPDGCLSLAVVCLPFASPFASCVGPRADALEVPAHRGTCIWGVRFRPAACGALTGASADRLRGYTGAPPASLTPAAHAMLEALREVRETDDAWSALERWGRELTIDEMDDTVTRAVETIDASRGQTPIPTVARAVGVSPRTLQRRFRAAVGLTPKEYARVRRLRHVLAEQLWSARPAWATIAASTGFADQAHLTRDLHELAGHSPATVARLLRGIEHRGVKP